MHIGPLCIQEDPMGLNALTSSLRTKHDRDLITIMLQLWHFDLKTYLKPSKFQKKNKNVTDMAYK
jgi:hypothetical protein